MLEAWQENREAEDEKIAVSVELAETEASAKQS
jgi:hypothetical protein